MLLQKEIPTQVTNLVKCEQGGKFISYFMRARICGKLVRKTLDTKSFEVAKRKLKDMHAAEKAMAESRTVHTDIKTVAELITEYKRLDAENREIGDATNEYHLECLGMIERT